MPRIRPLDIDEAPAESRLEWDKRMRDHGRMTNMKRTLTHSPRAFKALMEWYPLRDEVAAFLGDRLTYIFAHAISTQADCLICSTFFRRLLIDRGDDPDRFELDEWEQAVVDFGRQLAIDAHLIPDELYANSLTA